MSEDRGRIESTLWAWDPVALTFVRLETNIDGDLLVRDTGAAGGGGTEYVEDAVAPADPTGKAVALVRQDTPAGLVSANGDIVAQRATNFGAAYTQLLTSAGAFIDSIGGGTEFTDKQAFTEGTSGGIKPAGAVFNDTIVGDPAEDQITPLRITAKKGLHVNLRNVTGTEIGTSANPVSTRISDGIDQVLVTAAGELNVLATAQPSVDIGDVTINNAAGASAVNVQDGGNSLTVDAPVWIPLAVRQSDGAAFFKIPTSHVNNAVFVDAGAIAGQFDDVTPGALTENNVGPVRISANRNLYSTIRDAAGNERGANVTAGNALVIDGSASTQPISGTATANQGTPAATANRWPVQITDGTDLALVSVAGALLVDGSAVTQPVSGTVAVSSVTTSITPGTAATNLGKAEDAIAASGDTGVMALIVANEANTVRAADGDYIAPSSDTEGNLRVVGNRDHDAVDAGEVLATGGQAIAHGTNPTAVAAADRTRWYFNRAGVPFVIGGHPNIVTLRANATAAQTDVALVTVAAGLKIVVTRASVTADHANTVDVAARIGFGAVNTPTTTGVVLSHPGIAAGSGVVEGNGSGILGVGADGEDLRITNEVPTTGSIDVVVSYYTIES